MSCNILIFCCVSSDEHTPFATLGVNCEKQSRDRSIGFPWRPWTFCGYLFGVHTHIDKVVKLWMCRDLHLLNLSRYVIAVNLIGCLSCGAALFKHQFSDWIGGNLC